MITDVAGISVGHWTDADRKTGCTAVIFPPGTIVSGEVRGGAPGTREFALLDPTRTVTEVDAVVLSGGSAFGLATAEGAMSWLTEQGRGFPTAFANIPIVVGAVIYDLGVGDPLARPGAAEGRAACEAARHSVPYNVGRVGAGTGATVSKWRGRDSAKSGGLGTATIRHKDLVVGALIVVNAFGDVVGPGPLPVEDLSCFTEPSPSGENTTIGVIATNVRLDKRACHLLAQSAHDGIGRAIWPAHSLSDGDAIVAACVPLVDAPETLVRMMVVAATEQAIHAALEASS